MSNINLNKNLNSINSIKGIFPALVTPFNSKGCINETVLRQIVRMNLDKGVAGFYVCGSTAEAFLLSLEERKQVLEIVAEEAKGKCCLIAHIGCISTDHAIELGLHAKKVGVDAISSVSPFYYKFTFSELKNYYFDVANEVKLPMIVYNFPAFSGMNMTLENIIELKANPYIIGIKHTSMDLYQLERMKSEIKDLVVLNGYDEVFLAGLSMGADGAVGSTYNFMAEKFIEIERLYRQGRNKEAAQLQGEANGIIAVLAKVGVFQGIKYLLGKMGFDCGKCRKPFRELDESEKELLDEVFSLYLS